MPRNPNCRNCELWRSAVNVCVWGDGPTKAAVVAIGEAPGEAEARTGKPFQGRSGQLLRGELDRANLRDVYITNIVKCRPPDNRTPTPAEVKACAPYLAEELEQVRPRLIVTLGAPASKAVLKRAKITEAHGQAEQRPDGTWTMPAYHPAYVLRDPTKLPAFRADLERAARVLRGERRQADVPWRVVTRTSLETFVAHFSRSPEFAFDLETSGLFPYDRKGAIRCVGIALPEQAWVIPMSMPGSPFATPALQQRVMAILYQLAEGKRAVAHNGKFDNQWLSLYTGGTFHLTFDTMLAHHLLDENSPHGLKELVRSILDEPEYDISIREKKGEIDPQRLYEYCAKDAAYTLRLSHVFEKQLRRDVYLRKLFYRLTMPAARAFTEIEQRGLYLNLSAFRRTQQNVTQRLAEALSTLNSMVGREVNWNSPAQVAEVLFKDLGLRPRALTEAGKPSTAEATLRELRDEHPVAQALVAYRELEKFRSTYLDGWEELMVGPYIHFSYKLHGTVTGRYSSRLHSVPRDGTIRNLVTAPDGWEFVQGDLSQAELRVAAIVSRDPELRRCYAEGVDVHWATLLYVIECGIGGEFYDRALETACALTQRRASSIAEACRVLSDEGYEKAVAIWKGWKEGRKRAKAINFGFIYGMREPKFIETCKEKYDWEPTPDEATQIRTAYFHLYGGLQRWHESTRRLVHLNGYVRNLAGRKRRLETVFSADRSLVSEAERQAINSPIQGYIGDHKAMALIEIHSTFDPETELRVVGEHHDAILMWVRTDQKTRVLPRVAQIMAKPKLLEVLKVSLSIPLVGELEVGPWGAGKAWST